MTFSGADFRIPSSWTAETTVVSGRTGCSGGTFGLFTTGSAREALGTKLTVRLSFHQRDLSLRTRHALFPFRRSIFADAARKDAADAVLTRIPARTRLTVRTKGRVGVVDVSARGTKVTSGPTSLTVVTFIIFGWRTIEKGGVRVDQKGGWIDICGWKEIGWKRLEEIGWKLSRAF